MFDFIKNQQNEITKAEEREKNFLRERASFQAGVSDDASYMHTQTEKSDLIKWQQEFNQEIESLKHELKSEILTERGWQRKSYKEFDAITKNYKTKEVPQLCNDAFAEEICQQVKPFLNKNFVNSNIDDKTIRNMLRNTHNDIVGMIADSWGFNGIRTVDDASAICRIVKNYIDPAAFRSVGGWTKRTDSTMIKRIEALQEQHSDGARQKGIMGVLSTIKGGS